MNNKGTTILEYLIYIPIIAILTISVYMLVSTVIDVNTRLSNDFDFYTMDTLLEASILKDLSKGYNEVSFINGDKQQGFIINGSEYNFNDDSLIHFKTLNIDCDIIDNKLIVVTKYGANTYKKEFNIEYWENGNEEFN